MTEEKKQKLTPKRELFCKLFASDREFFGNGTQSYIEAYDIDLREKGAYHSARSSAQRLLTKDDILDRITEIMEKCGFTNVAIDKELAFLIKQNADYKSKLGAIREFNKLKQRIIEKTDLTSGGKVLDSIVIYKPKKDSENR